MKCELCGVGPFESALHRQNEKGVPGIWRCAKCNTLPIDSVVAVIIDILEKDNKKNDH